MMNEQKKIQQIGSIQSKTSKNSKILCFKIFEKFDENAYACNLIKKEG